MSIEYTVRRILAERHPSEWLRISESYMRDAEILEAGGDADEAKAYRKVARRLRKAHEGGDGDE